ncbi:porin [Marinicella rhabdoformis]|uniref:porin n=1 Tax=Marinicella rhabdoformis TaxID=2580566 RepID=UPI0012AEB228|nr:porin [Marinicella rhabdoformis]
MKKISILALTMCSAMASAAEKTPSMEDMWKIIQEQQKTIEALQNKLNVQETEIADTTKKVQAQVVAQEEALAVVSDAIEDTVAVESKTKIGGYGELHYNNLDSGEDIDFHRFVMFFGHDFNEKTRFFSEFELEHALAGDGKPGEVELEQAYIEHMFNDTTKATFGVSLVPVGILNETHEPNTFYGVERNAVEKNIIPSTWWEAGVGMNKQVNDKLGFDLFLSSGLNTPVDGSKAFIIRSGRQKVAEAKASDLAYTARVRFNPFKGLQLAATYQHQTDLTQGAMDVAADLFEANLQYNIGGFGLRALYAEWNLDDNVAAVNAAREEQSGFYIEPSYRFGNSDQFGVFARYSVYNNNAADASSKDKKQTDIGMNFWLTPQTVFKIDYQDQKDGASNDGFNLGVGYSF